MTNPNDVGGSDAELPKKKGLDLSIFMKPVAEVDTSIGKLYLFPLRDSDMRAFNALSATAHVERTREFRGLYHVLGGNISPIDGRG